MGTRGLRGSTLEDLINFSIERYREEHLALIQKIPTPIKPVRIEQESRHITLAYFDQKSTVDYIGVVQGVPVCFDAKECSSDTFPLQNIHAHQMDFMRDFERQQGVAFFLLSFPHRNEFFYLPYRDALRFWERAEEGGRKSFLYEEIDAGYRISQKGGLPLHFLEQIQKDLLERD